MTYRLYFAGFNLPSPNAAYTIIGNNQISFLFDPANTDYQKFKSGVASGVELQDPDGNIMTQEQVNEFLNTIP